MNLLMAIMMVETGGVGPNPLQISRAYVKDCNTILGEKVYTYADVDDRAISYSMASVYLHHYGERYFRLTGELPNDEVYARIHNGGPDGWKKACTKAYWEKIKQIMGKR